MICKVPLKCHTSTECRIEKMKLGNHHLYVRVARPQDEVGTKDLFRVRIVLRKIRRKLPNLVDVSDIFNFFSAQGGGRGSPRRRGGGGGWFFFMKIPERGGDSRRGRGRGAGRVSGANWGIFFLGGVGLFFLGGAETSTKRRLEVRELFSALLLSRSGRQSCYNPLQPPISLLGGCSPTDRGC